MGANQICINVPQNEDRAPERSNSHAPNPDFYPQVGDDPSSLPCGINHMRQQLASKKLRPPQDYKPAPFSKDSFYQIVKDTAYYRGQWSYGQPNGLGQVIFRDKSYFRGYLKDMKAKGPECLFVLSDGAYYLGGVANNKRDGKGTFTDHGYVYEGQWRDNRPHGNAKETFKNGDFFQGKFVQGNRKGSGVYMWAKGPYQRFQGYFQQNMFEKKGIITLRDGTVVEGQFSCNSTFDISSCTITNKQYRLNNCEVTDGHIQHFQFERGEYKVRGEVPKRKKVIMKEKGLSEETTNTIIGQIESGYRYARKHSEALANMKETLPKYRCEFYQEGQDKGAILIVQICGKKIKISKPD